ncbi:MAG: PHP-associated domain-containing protein [Myxococcota bacterium]
MIVDLHVSLDTPEGTPVPPDTLIQSAKAAGLDGLVLSSAQGLSFDIEPYRSAAIAADLRVFMGARVQTNRGLILCIMPPGYVLSDDFADRAPDGDLYDAASVVDAVEHANGVTVALRPYDRDLQHPMGDHLFSLQGLVACEVANGQLSEIANDLALEAATNMDMPCVGSSSALGTEGLGTAATLFRYPVATEAELCDALRDGACWPVTFSDELPAEPPRRSRGAGARSGGSGASGGRSSARNERGASRGDRGRGRRRRKPAGGTGRDGVGNTARGRSADLPDDVGNRARPDEQNLPSDDVGNRLAPGESSPLRPSPRTVPEEVESDDDNFGNR